MSAANKQHGPLTIEQLAGLEPASQWDLAPDGRSVAYLHNVAGIKQLWVMPLTGGFPHRVTAERKDCSAPQFAPDSRRLVFVRDNGLYVMNDDGSECRRLWKHESGIQEPRWSPDGAQIAFLSRQRGWSQIWVMRLDEPRPRCVTPEPHDHEGLAWSPDSTRIAYVLRLPDDLRNSDIFARGIDGGQPERLTEGGSLDYAPAWSPDGRLIAYVSDADGWPHIWRVDLETRQRTQLTSGQHEDGMVYAGRGEGPHWSPQGWIAFLRNRDAKFDLMVMNSSGTFVQRVSRYDGMRSIIGWLPDSSAVLTEFHSPQHAAALARVDLGFQRAHGEAPRSMRDLDQLGQEDSAIKLESQEQLLTDSLAGLRPADFIAPERVSYTSRDGLTIHGYLWKPRDMQPDTRYPAIVYAHGGPTWQVFYRFQALLALLAQEGYVVLGPDFRGSIGYGNAFRQANFQEWGHNDLFDLVDGANWLKGQSFVDPERVGIFGGSYGGYMVLCALAFTPDVFAAGVDLFGDSEISESYRHGDRIGRLDLQMQMGSPDENSELYRRGSPVYAAEHIQAPVLILHGKDDARVVPLMSEKMIEALKIENKFHEAHFYEGEGHGFIKPENQQDYMERVLKFFNRHLKGELDD